MGEFAFIVRGQILGEAVGLPNSEVFYAFIRAAFLLQARINIGGSNCRLY